MPIADGTGAARYGGRWNSPGRWVIYAAETYAGALIEKMVHSNIGRIPKGQQCREISIPADVSAEEVTAAEIPEFAAEDEELSREFGNVWCDSKRSAVLWVPSVVARGERNVVIHQMHPEFKRISFGVPEPVIWDRRLFLRPE